MYLNLVQLAESFGVSERVVQDWVRHEGLPHVADRGQMLFDRAHVAKWAAGHGLTARAGFLAAEKGTFRTEFSLAAMLRAGGIWRDVPAPEVRDVLARVLASMTRLPQPVQALLAARVREGRGIAWAPVGAGFALPHFSTHVTVGRDCGLVALLLLRQGLSLSEPAVDQVPVTRLLFFLPPSPRAHLDVLGRLARVIAEGHLRELLDAGATDEEILRAIAVTDAEPASGAQQEPAR